MIPVQGVSGQTIAVLGLGRSGKATAAALLEGGAKVVVWDDGQEARAQAEAEGLEVRDLTRDAAWEGISTLITSPGIPHLYPTPNKVIARALEAGIPVDNDIGQAADLLDAEKADAATNEAACRSRNTSPFHGRHQG